MSRSRVIAAIPSIFWVLTVVSIVVWSQWPDYIVGWDLNVYKLAMLSLRSGHDPYLACIAARKLYFDQFTAHPLAPRPFGYVYPPLTLPLLRMMSSMSVVAIGTIYWSIYAICVMVALWASTFAVRKDEQTAFAFLAPSAVFFPGLLHSDPIFSGNIAYIFYGFIFAGAVVGWRSGKWRWFYLAVLLASLIKPTFLSLLGIPLLTAAGQWLPSLGTAALSLCANLSQELFWPVQFAHYRLSLESQVVDYFHDFGLHPAGVLADALYNRVPYLATFGVLYIVCTVLFGTVLLHLRKRFFRGEISLQEWIPVALIGVTFLNPRIMQYDLLPITLPMALVAWRFSRRWFRNQRTLAIVLAVIFFTLNVLAEFAWTQTECLLLVGVFLAGAWTLQYETSFVPAIQSLRSRAAAGRSRINADLVYHRADRGHHAADLNPGLDGARYQSWSLPQAPRDPQ